MAKFEKVIVTVYIENDKYKKSIGKVFNYLNKNPFAGKSHLNPLCGTITCGIGDINAVESFLDGKIKVKDVYGLQKLIDGFSIEWFVSDLYEFFDKEGIRYAEV
jgi:hypothetical protein